MRSIPQPFVVGSPAGVRIRTRLRLTAADEVVLQAIGAHLGRLASKDLAWRCRLGRGNDQRALRKRAATRQSSSRWAGTITRTSNDQWQRELANLADQRIALRRTIRMIRVRLTAPVGGKQGPVRGYPTRAERYSKHRRLQHLEAKLLDVEMRLGSARVSVRRGGRKLAKLRHHLGPIRYDISYRPDRDRWYLDASWQTRSIQPPALDELRQGGALGVDLNADHLACWVVDSSGNPVGRPHSVTLPLDGLPASTRDGRLRAAITAILGLARANGCRSIVIEDLVFTDVRQVGRETLGRGRRARRFRNTVAGIPTRRFRTLLAGMAANAGVWIVAVDPGWTSKWGQRYWLAPLNVETKSSVVVTRHHAAAIVIARRGQGIGARRRRGVTRHDQRIVTGELPARPGQWRPDPEGPGPPEDQRAAAAPRKTLPV